MKTYKTSETQAQRQAAKMRQQMRKAARNLKRYQPE